MSRIFNFFKLNQRFFFTSVLSGILISASYIPFPPWAILFCYLPVWSEIVLNPSESPLKSFFRGWTAQFTMALIGFHWISYVSVVYGYMPWPVAGIVLLLFASFIHLYIAFACGLTQFLRQKRQLNNLSTLILLATLTSFAEIFWPRLFPWNLGYSIYGAGSPLAQHADTIGFLGLSFAILVLNAVITWLYLRKNPRSALISFACIGVLLSLFYYLGVQKKEYWSKSPDKIQITQIQANIGNVEKLMAERGEGYQDAIIDKYFSLTKKSLIEHPETNLIIWPETAFPYFLNPQTLYEGYGKRFADFIQEIKKPILTGAYSLEPAQPKNKHYNGLFLYQPNLELNGFYHKTKLLVFGEYTPLSSTFPWLATISPAGEGWTVGSGPKVIHFGDITIGPQVCYEGLYPDFSNALVKQGADLIVNLTNDSWFGPTSEPYQHMLMTLARSIETRRPVIRNTNTGITTAALADGSILQKSPLFSEWTGTYDIQYKKDSELTFYSRFGDYLPIVLLFIIILILGLNPPKVKNEL